MLLAAAALLGVLATTSIGAAADGDTTRRVSVDSAEKQANASSIRPSISSDGRFVAFSSEASDLVRNDANGDRDVFVRDLRTGTTERVSVSSSGSQANGTSRYPSINAGGRFVAFESNASDLVQDDTNGSDYDVFVHNRFTGATELVSVDSYSLSDPRVQGNNSSTRPSINGDGQEVAFDSLATNLEDEPDTNGKRDVFVHLRDTTITYRVSVNSSGSQANGTSHSPSISSDGHFVAFSSEATNLVRNDTNDAYDVFVRDAAPEITRRVSVSSSGSQANGSSDDASISADGRFVAFSSEATNLVRNDTNGARDVFVRDLRTGTTERVSVNSAGSQANGTSRYPSISENGRFVAFDSRARNLVRNDTNGDYDVFVRDLRTGTTRRVSVNSAGNQGNASSDNASIGYNASVVAFASRARNLVANDTNSAYDVFVHERSTTTP